jgi:hypothetical protein
MKTSTSLVSYSCACSQMRSHNSVRVKTRPRSRIRCGGFKETKGNAVATFYLFQCRNFRIPGVSIFRNL